MSLAIVLVAILPAILVTAAVFDLTSYTIPNFFPIAMVALFIVFLVVMAAEGHALALDRTELHLLAGVIGLLAGMGMFAAGWVGGGDAKFFAVAALWLGWDSLYEYTLLSSLLGGCLTIGLILLRLVPLPEYLQSQGWLVRLTDRGSGIPYGVALAIAALVEWPGTDLFRLAALS